MRGAACLPEHAVQGGKGMKNRKLGAVLAILLLLAVIAGVGCLAYPRICNDGLACRDLRRTARYVEAEDRWTYADPDVRKMSLRAVACYRPEQLFAECFFRATPQQQDRLVAAHPYEGEDREWLYSVDRGESWFMTSNTRQYLEIMHVIPKSDRRLTLEKAYEILSGCVPGLLSRTEDRDPADTHRVERGKLTRYEVYQKVLRALNGYAICEDRGCGTSAGWRYAEYDLTDGNGDLVLVVSSGGPLGLSAAVYDRAEKTYEYVLFTDREDLTREYLAAYYDLTYYIPDGSAAEYRNDREAYAAATELYEAGNYGDALRVFRSLDYGNSAEMAEKCREMWYDQAVSDLEAGDYYQAMEAFRTLDGFRDSAAKYADAQAALKDAQRWESFSGLEVGDFVTFGTYERDNDPSDGKEAVSWHVLDRKDGAVLLLCDSALDCRPYDVSGGVVTWETCSLREWLNGTFLDEAFSEKERERILCVNVSADPNPSFDTDPGGDTADRFFLLSIPEVERYLIREDQKQCMATGYCKAQGAVTDAYGYCRWWLRTPGKNSGSAVIVDTYGTVVFEGVGADNDRICAIRPAVWVSLEP